MFIMEKIAIRVEHSDGIGMFRHYTNDDRYRKYHVGNVAPDVLNRHMKFRTPFEEDIDFDTSIHFCAYKSIEQFKEWVTPEEILLLLERGYKVYLLTLSFALEGRDQVCYSLDDVIDKRDISSLFV